MRNTFIFFFFVLAAISVSCEDETKPVDPVYEFIAFKGQPVVNVNELINSTEPLPLVMELRAFSPYPDDIEVTFGIAGYNAAINSDFEVSPAGSVIIPAGSFVSDTIFVSTVDNATGSTEPRSFDLRILSASKEGIKIGLGLTEPKNAVVTVNILDDECSETIAVFNSSNLTNTIDWGDGNALLPATGVVTNNTIKVSGDLIGYAPLANAAITITLTPDSEGATRGTATFGEQVAGTDSDGWEYKFVQTGEGRYDVCSGVITVAYDIYYLDGASWVLWYSVTNQYAAG